MRLSSSRAFSKDPRIGKQAGRWYIIGPGNRLMGRLQILAIPSDHGGANSSLAEK